MSAKGAQSESDMMPNNEALTALKKGSLESYGVIRKIVLSLLESSEFRWYSV